MDALAAVKILGCNRATYELRNMARALKSFGFLNTPEENERLEAVEWALKHPAKFWSACDKRRNRKED